MKTLRVLLLTFMALTVVFAAGVFGETGKTDDEGDRMFELMDKNKDGKISKEEWNAIDGNKDGKITPDEWKRYNFESSKNIKWIDTNADGNVDRREFRENFKR